MIRYVQPKDLDAVNSLLHQVNDVHAEGRPDIFIKGKKKYTDEELLELFKDKTRPIFVYTEEDDIPLGYAFCIFEETKGMTNLYDMKSLYIDDICVDEKYRGRKIATKLYEYLQNFARENGCYRITLNVWEVNPVAQKFYEKMGMKPLKTVMEEVL